MARKKWAIAGLVTAAVAGYGTLDAYDVVPGVLTLQHSNAPDAAKVNGTTYEPLVKAVATTPLSGATQGALPQSAALKKALDDALKNPWFGQTTVMTVRDATTGATLYERDSSKTTTPASVTKVATSFAIAHSKLGLGSRLTTKAMLDGSHLQLVAGGDMMLDTGNGDAGKIVGHAGLGDLAQQAASSLKKQGLTHVTLDLNTAYNNGPDKAPGWSDGFLSGGYTEHITMLGLAKDRSDDKTPAVADPAKNAADAYIAALKTQGITATFGKKVTSAPTGNTVASVTSAPIVDVLGVALQDSDNAMIESLARQAAALDGVHGDSKAIGVWVINQLKAQGINVNGMKLADVCGLSDGTTLPVRILGDILEAGASGKDAAFEEVMDRLPVAGWNGTMDGRFLTDTTNVGQGVVRAKTGSLTGVASLAGDTLTKSHHRVVFAMTTNGTFNEGAMGARAAIDGVIAALMKA